MVVSLPADAQGGDCGRPVFLEGCTGPDSLSWVRPKRLCERARVDPRTPRRSTRAATAAPGESVASPPTLPRSARHASASPPTRLHAYPSRRARCCFPLRCQRPESANVGSWRGSCRRQRRHPWAGARPRYGDVLSQRAGLPLQPPSPPSSVPPQTM